MELKMYGKWIDLKDELQEILIRLLFSNFISQRIVKNLCCYVPRFNFGSFADASFPNCALQFCIIDRSKSLHVDKKELPLGFYLLKSSKQFISCPYT